jgi:hypothetical protein
MHSRLLLISSEVLKLTQSSSGSCYFTKFEAYLERIIEPICTGIALEEAISKDESRKSSDLLTWDRDDRESQKYMGLTLSPGRRTRGHVASDSTPECALVYGDGCKSLIYLLVEAR